MDRRVLCVSGLVTLAGLVAGCRQRGAPDVTHITVGAPAAPGSDSVSIVEFTNAGVRLGVAEVPRVVKTEAEWRDLLTGLQYTVTRQEGTERPFTGPLLREHRRGVFRCVCCETALFGSETKFESGTGWPSFWRPLAEENLLQTLDDSFGMSRTAVSCARCEAHQGHLFTDGPAPTGLRYCINSAALVFAAAV